MTLAFLIITAGVFFLAFSNGANDNFKGVATLLGSKTASYKTALFWATVTTLSGSIVAFFLAQKLMVNFSGKGLVPDEIVGLASFSASVAVATATTVILATRFGYPISTTHALTGSLVGAGLLASPEGVHFSKLLTAFVLPLFLSPILAIVGASLIYPLFSSLRKRFGVSRESCLCIGREVLMTAPQGLSKGATAAVVQMQGYPQISVGTKVSCEDRYVGQVWGVSAKSILDVGHFLSAGMVSFARGLNDTPKIAAILLTGGALGALPSIGLVAVMIAIGGIIYSRRIANTMAYQITEMNDGQGFTGNFVTSLIVIGATQLGMPVSTTHVSCGTLFGIGTVTKKAHWGSIVKIVLAWVITLPIACLLGVVSFYFLKGVL